MEIKRIPLSLVTPSPMNPRKTFDEGDLQELADNIENQGLLQPITVRPTDDGKFEIICGERRYRASMLLKQKEDKSNVEKASAHRKKSDKFQSINAIVREMTDEEAFDAMITENIQRKDVDPIEEAFAFGQLIKTGKTIEEIAARFGKSTRFVTERVKLNTLIPDLMLAVKDEKMPIVAALIICKLDEEHQKEYYNSYIARINGFTKSSAQSFVDGLFMTLDKSLWYRSDNKADREFTGGCGRQCSECSLNTANHGCLFYEMKCEDGGRCTDKEKFKSKTIAYILHELDRQSDRLVKAGEPLALHKTVVGIEINPYEPEGSKELKAQVKELVEARGYEIVDPTKTFRSKCWYGADDERTIDMIKSGEVYRVINIFNYDKATVNEQYWYVKKECEDEQGNGLPVNVASILNQIKTEKTGLQSKLTCECAKAMSANAVSSNEPLTDLEKKLLCLLILESTYALRKELGINANVLYRDDAYKFVEEHPDIFNQCARALLQSKVSLGNNAALLFAEPMLDELGALWCADEYQKAKDATNAKYEKKIAKLTKQLADLGYDTEGKPLVSKEGLDKSDILAQSKKLKAKHPDALLIFRVGDYYQLFSEDAEIAAPILELTLTPWYVNPKVNQCGFKHSAIDTMVPKLIRAGKRVAICEPLEDPKKYPHTTHIIKNKRHCSTK